MEYSLLDVSNAISSPRPTTFNRLKCFVVNYSAENDFPHKFFYNGCTVSRSNGTYCARASCGHSKKFSMKMYRLKLLLSDRSSSPPLHVTVFDSGFRVLMKMSAEELSTRSPEAQLALVREKTSRGEMCDLFLKVKEDAFTGEFVAVVSMIFIADDKDEVIADLMRSPTSSPGLLRSPSSFYTPRGEDDGSVRDVVGESSSLRTQTATRSGSRSARLSNMKKQIEDLNIAIIDLTSDD